MTLYDPLDDRIIRALATLVAIPAATWALLGWLAA